MTPNRRKGRALFGNVTVGLLAAALLTAPSLGYSEPGAISFEDCEINGFGLGASASLMRSIFGDPEPISIAKSPLSDYPHREYKYDGLKIVFSTHGRSAMYYIVTSSKYRLTSGVGVGSNVAEIQVALGPGGRFAAGDQHYLSYRVFNTAGKPTPAILWFMLDDDVVTEFSVGTR